MSEKNGGPAFPFVGCSLDAQGMSLRDYFAANVLTAFAAAPHWRLLPDMSAEKAYEFADAMLRAREVKP